LANSQRNGSGGGEGQEREKETNKELQGEGVNAKRYLVDATKSRQREQAGVRPLVWGDPSFRRKKSRGTKKKGRGIQ